MSTALIVTLLELIQDSPSIGYYRGRTAGGLVIYLYVRSDSAASLRFASQDQASELTIRLGEKGELLFSKEGVVWLQCNKIDDWDWAEELDGTLRARPVRPDKPSADKLQQWIEDLEHDEPRVRDRASAELATSDAHQELRDTLQKKIGAETRARIEALLDRRIRFTRVATETIRTHHHSRRISATVRHPHLLVGDKEVRSAVQEAQREAIERTAKEFESFLDELDSDGISTRYYEEDWALGYVSDELVSLCATVNMYGGGAHGTCQFQTRNLWIRNGKARPVELKDLFRSDLDYLKPISDALIADLKAQQAGWITSGEITSIDANRSTWSIRSNGLVFHFGNYEVGCYAEGVYAVTLSWGILDALISPDGPLSLFIRNAK